MTAKKEKRCRGIHEKIAALEDASHDRRLLIAGEPDRGVGGLHRREARARRGCPPPRRRPPWRRRGPSPRRSWPRGRPRFGRLAGILLGRGHLVLLLRFTAAPHGSAVLASGQARSARLEDCVKRSEVAPGVGDELVHLGEPGLGLAEVPDHASRRLRRARPRRSVARRRGPPERTGARSRYSGSRSS